MIRRVRGSALPLVFCLTLTLCACDDWKRELKEPFQPKDENWQKVVVQHAPLPESAFRVRWDGHTVPPVMHPNEEIVARVSFTNLGDAVWPDAAAGDPVKHDGGYAVRLSCQWIDPNNPSARPTRRIELPHPVHPGETISLLVDVKAPATPGSHQLQFELLQELVEWFDTKGAQKLVIPVTVQ